MNAKFRNAVQPASSYSLVKLFNDSYGGLGNGESDVMRTHALFYGVSGGELTRHRRKDRIGAPGITRRLIKL